MDYIPRADLKFEIFSGNIVALAIRNLAKWLIPDAEVDGLVTVQEVWTPAFNLTQNRETTSPSNRVRKNTAKAAFIKKLRPFIQRWLYTNPLVTDGDLTDLGLRIRKSTRTPAGIPKGMPHITLKHIGNHIHHLIYRDPNVPAHRRGKPKGTARVRVKISVGENPPKNIEDYPITVSGSRNPILLKFDASQAGLPFSVSACWENESGDAGVYSPPISSFVQ